jgi:hypothetical protein
MKTWNFPAAAAAFRAFLSSALDWKLLNAVEGF